MEGRTMASLTGEAGRRGTKVDGDVERKLRMFPSTGIVSMRKGARGIRR